MDRGTGIAVDPNLNTYFVGDTTSTNLQVEECVADHAQLDQQRVRREAGDGDGFEHRLRGAIVSPTGTVSAGNQVTITFTVANNGPDPATILR